MISNLLPPQMPYDVPVEVPFDSASVVVGALPMPIFVRRVP